MVDNFEFSWVNLFFEPNFHPLPPTQKENMTQGCTSRVHHFSQHIVDSLEHPKRALFLLRRDILICDDEDCKARKVVLQIIHAGFGPYPISKKSIRSPPIRLAKFFPRHTKFLILNSRLFYFLPFLLVGCWRLGLGWKSL